MLVALMFGMVMMTVDLVAADEANVPAAAVVIEPGDDVPPFVQLSPDEAPIVWDAKHVGEFQLVDQWGDPVTRESLLGTPWVANFVFARCVTHCPMMSRKIMELNQELADVPVRFVTITVDPEHDTVPLMKEFSDTWNATKDRWLFCTGEPAQVWNLIRKGFKVAAWENVGTKKLPGMEFAHTNQLVHVDKDGVIQGRYDSGAAFEVEVLKKVLKGQIQTPVKYRPATLDAEGNAVVQKENPLDKLPEWAKRLPATNAMLNSFSTLLLLMGFFAAKAGKFRLHKRLMLTAFLVSIVFLVCYLTSHWALHHYAGLRGRPFNGTGIIRPVYFSILISHVILAAMVPVLAIITIRNGLKAYPDNATPEQLAALGHERRVHHRWAKVTFPVWLYVSVTGVVIYFMLYWI